MTRCNRCFWLLLTICLCSLDLVNTAQAGKDWPGWRGPTGMGQTDEQNLPLTWNEKTRENILWKVPLFTAPDKVRLDQNQSSPIAVGERVFVTTSYWPISTPASEYPEHHVTCYRAATGERLWDSTVQPGPWLLKDLRGGYTAPTPATDGQRVFVLFGSAVLAALDMQGKLVWREEINPHFFDVAIGGSPVIHGNTVLLVCDQLREKKSSCLLAFAADTGKLRWKQERPNDDWTHGTPVLATINGKMQLLVAGANALQGIDPDTGRMLWTYKTSERIGDTVSPVYVGGIVYCDSGRGGPGIAVDPTGAGDVSETHLKWKIPKVPQGFSSPVFVGDHIFRLHSKETLKCWERSTGKTMWSERLESVSTSSSPFVTPQGLVYCASSGTSYVIQAGPKFQLLAVNELSDPSPSSPAVADGRIFLKGVRYLYCIGKRPQ